MGNTLLFSSSESQEKQQRHQHRQAEKKKQIKTLHSCLKGKRNEKNL